MQSYGFMALLARSGEADVFAFCDQDDVWLPDKLQRAIQALATVEGDVPAIYCSRQQLVDRALRPITAGSPPNRRCHSS